MAQNYNYAEVLQKSIYFYEAERSGPLPANNRINWRGNSAMQDGSDVGKNLTGGWYDAGDHVKFNFPMAFSATMLAWGAIDYQQGYVKAGQLAKIKESLRWVNDYLIKCHTAPNELYGQVGNGGMDHAWWGPAEVMQMARPSYKIDATHPGSDLAGETAAAMAAASMVFATEDPAYSQLLLTHAKQLYTFADTHRGKYSDAITDATAYYNSWSGYQDELVWGAIWLYRATGDAAYLAKAEAEYPKLGTESQSTIHSYKWTTAWDDKSYGSYVLLAKATGKAQYKDDAERWLDYWTVGYNGQRITYTPGGLAWLDTWGSLRYAANTAFMAFLYSDFTTDTVKKQRYYNFAKSQIHYMLGTNPGNRSFVVGFGNNPPINPHHRTAHGGWANNLSTPVNNRHIIHGALVGGPGANDAYEDDRGNFTTNEIACDYNAGFSGAVARLTQEFGGTAVTIPQETPVDEFTADAKINTSGIDGSQKFFEPAVFVYNHTAWPARVTPNLAMRYFIDISEGLAKGYTIANYKVTGNFIQSGAVNGGLKLWSGSIYYAEIQFANANMYPGGQSECRLEAQFRLYGPSDAFDASNDWSGKNLTGTHQRIDNITIYEGGVLKGGIEPGSGPVNVPVTGVTVSPTTATLNVGQTQQLSATVAPANASNKTVSWTSGNTAVATVNASGLVTAVAAGSATITVTTQNGSKTVTAQITVNGSVIVQTPYDVVIPLPGVVEAENFDNGGEGIAFHDTTPTNLIGPFRSNTAVDTEPCSETGNNLAFSDNGEWLEYSVNVAT
ncbi:MAG: glycoside hydrolase family 9 protein, partial [Bacteroidota bacterium]